MLEDVAANGHEDVISWQPHGRAFRVHKPLEFATRVMSCYFKKQTQYKSFQRQLHIYGFRRITGKGMLDNGAYYHEKFIRGQQHVSLRMVRQKIKGKKEVSDWHSHSDPDFYARNGMQQQQLGSGGRQALASEIGIVDEVLSRPPTTTISANESTLGWATEPNKIFSSRRPTSNNSKKDSESQMPSCTILSSSEFTSSSLPGPIMDLLLHDGDEGFFEGMRFFFASSAPAALTKTKPKQEVLLAIPLPTESGE
jgi:hypothetical protein